VKRTLVPVLKRSTRITPCRSRALLHCRPPVATAHEAPRPAPTSCRCVARAGRPSAKKAVGDSRLYVPRASRPRASSCQARSIPVRAPTSVRSRGRRVSKEGRPVARRAPPPEPSPPFTGAELRCVQPGAIAGARRRRPSSPGRSAGASPRVVAVSGFDFGQGRRRPSKKSREGPTDRRIRDTRGRFLTVFVGFAERDEEKVVREGIREPMHDPRRSSAPRTATRTENGKRSCLLWERCPAPGSEGDDWMLVGVTERAPPPRIEPWEFRRPPRSSSPPRKKANACPSRGARAHPPSLQVEPKAPRPVFATHSTAAKVGG